MDRDGVINYERGEHTFLVKDFIINEGLFEALTVLKNRGYIFIIITNQSGIALNKYTVNDMEECHKYLIAKAKQANIHFEEIYYCPHHPSVSKCLCRKPDSLLLEKAIDKYNVDIHKSWFIGDKLRDMQAAEKLGVNHLLINPNKNINEILHLIA